MRGNTDYKITYCKLIYKLSVEKTENPSSYDTQYL